MKKLIPLFFLLSAAGFFMVVFSLSVPVRAAIIKCAHCKGTGFVSERRECTKCDSKGVITCTRCIGAGDTLCKACSGKGSQKALCLVCNSTGIVNDQPCTICEGKGWKMKPCTYCGGLGKVRCPRCNGRGQEICSLCRGRGKRMLPVPCKICAGKGKIIPEKVIK